MWAYLESNVNATAPKGDAAQYDLSIQANNNGGDVINHG